MKCPNKQCAYSHKKISKSVQAEVDVAIATKIVSSSYQNTYDHLILIAGDRDFKDPLLEAIHMKKHVTIFGYENSVW